MARTAQTPRFAQGIQHGAIMRLITIVALGALLLLGFVAIGHGDTSPGPTSAVASVGISSSSASLHGEGAEAASVSELDSATTLSGVALCVLGVLCGFVLYLVVTVLFRRRARTHLTFARKLPPASVNTVALRSKGRALTIAQLQVSRT